MSRKAIVRSILGVVGLLVVGTGGAVFLGACSWPAPVVDAKKRSSKAARLVGSLWRPDRGWSRWPEDTPSAGSTGTSNAYRGTSLGEHMARRDPHDVQDTGVRDDLAGCVLGLRFIFAGASVLKEWGIEATDGPLVICRRLGAASSSPSSLRRCSRQSSSGRGGPAGQHERGAAPRTGRYGPFMSVFAAAAARRNGSGLLRVEGDSDLVVVRADAGQARLSCRKRHETERNLACTRR
jgi:hypothetical protein